MWPFRQRQPTTSAFDGYTPPPRPTAPTPEEPAMTQPADVRLATIREICRREGHGGLAEVTTYGDYWANRSEYICQRGCGVKILRLGRAHTVEEIQRRLTGGVIHMRGDVELWPAEDTKGEETK